MWCGIVGLQVIGPYFFRGNLNSEMYLNFLENEIGPVIDEISLQIRQYLHFQHDGAPIHSTIPVTTWLNQTFGNKWIGRKSLNSFPARSPDLTPMDFFFWGYLKNKVYKHRPFQNVDNLEDIIRQYCQNIPPTFLRNVCRETNKRTIKCILKNGGHIE